MFLMFFQGFPKSLHAYFELRMKATNSSLFQRRTVKEMLWGYKDPFVDGDVGLFVPVSKDVKAILPNNKQPGTFNPLKMWFKRFDQFIKWNIFALVQWYLWWQLHCLHWKGRHLESGSDWEVARRDVSLILIQVKGILSRYHLKSEFYAIELWYFRLLNQIVHVWRTSICGQQEFRFLGRQVLWHDQRDRCSSCRNVFCKIIIIKLFWTPFS